MLGGHYLDPLVFLVLLAEWQVSEVDRIEANEVPLLRHPSSAYQLIILGEDVPFIVEGR